MGKDKNTSVVIAAAGNSSRLETNKSKLFLELEGKPLLFFSLEKFLSMGEILKEIVVVTNDILNTENLLKNFYNQSEIKIKVVQGGNLRQDSVYNGFKNLSSNVEIVIVHDIARPFFDLNDLNKCIEKAYEYGAAILAVPVVDTLKKVKKNNKKKNELIIDNTLDRDFVYQVQTPQVFKYELLERVYSDIYGLKSSSFTFTDEAQMVEHLGEEVCIVESKRNNIKITYNEDIELAREILNQIKTKDKTYVKNN